MAAKAYEESEELKALKAQLQQSDSEKPAPYSSLWQQELASLLDAITNREAFSYDPEGDALYRTYQNLYRSQGQRAMEDTMGQASALTGGYGNSYAVTAGQQAYQNSLSQLQQMLPQLQSLALERYQASGDALQQRYDALQQQEDADYRRYRDALSDWKDNQKTLSDRLASRQEHEYNRYRDTRDYDYQLKRDEIEDRRWQKEFDEAVRQFGVRWG